MPEEAAAATFADLFAAETVGTAATATATAAATGAGAAAGGFLEKMGTSLATGAAGAVASSILSEKPKMPTLAAPTPMPDPLAQEQAKQRAVIEQMARRGRAASILTDTSGTAAGKLGG